MKTLNRMKQIETLALAKVASYVIDYHYDAKGRIDLETITGGIARTTSYEYDDATDNIVKETVVENGVTLVKDYEYDVVTNNIAKVTVTNS